MFQKIFSLCAVAALAAVLPLHAAPPAKPNVILFLVDDMGWADCGVYGSTYYQTPNMDRLATRAMRFTDAYAQPLCSPTRACLLTGKGAARHGITSATGHLPPQPPGYNFLPKTAAPNKELISPESKNYMEPSEYTLAEALRDAGWRTAHIGKWHLGLTEPHWPDKQGFQVAVHAHPDPGPPSYFSPYGFREFQSYPDGPPGEYITDRLTDEAIKFITESKDQPFFLNLWHHGVHGPWGHKEEYTKKFAALKDPRGLQANPIMGSMLQSVDESLGRIVETLDRLKLTENTILIFNSDNGGNTHSNSSEDAKLDRKESGGAKQNAQMEDWRKWAGGLPPTNNAPLRDGKASLYEGGVRVPLMWVWPGVVKPGTTVHDVVGAIDLYPTLLDLLHVPRSPEQVMDGVSYASVLKSTGPLQRAAYFNFFPHGSKGKPGGASVRAGDWKLIRWFETGPGYPSLHELYNLKDDLSETKNLEKSMPDKVAELDAMLTNYLQETHALLPIPNPAYRAPAAAAAGPAKPGQPDPLLGWKPKQCQAVMTEDGLAIEPEKKAQPFLGSNQVKAEGAVVLTARIRSGKGGAGKVQWRTADQSEFPAEGQAVEYQLKADAEWQEIKLPLPVKGQLAQMRFYLPKDQRLEIASVQLLPAKGGPPVHDWTFAPHR